MALSIQPTRVFWVEPTGRWRRAFRVWGDKVAGCSHYYCESIKPLDVVEEERVQEPDGDWHWKSYDVKDFPWDSFKTTCDHCGREIQNAYRQIETDRIYVAKTGERAGQEFIHDDLPVGAMWDAVGYGVGYTGPDGIALTIKMPGRRTWMVDSQASNCTKNQYQPVADDPRARKFVRTHYCWVRRGDPRTGYVHVDKDATVQETCEAGAGSIWIDKDGPSDWHGFLYRGFLIDADGHSRGIVDRFWDGVHPNPVAPAERVMPVHRLDSLSAARATRRPMTRAEAVAKRRAQNSWRSTRRP